MRLFARSPPLAARLLGQRDMDINGTMCGGIGGRNSKDDFASDYDSDETVIDDSSLGSYDENDQLQLKSLFFNKDDTRTPAKLCHFGNEMLVHLSPEIQHLSKLEHNNQAQTRDVSMEEHTCFQSAEVSANSKSSLIKYKSQELEDDNSVTFSKNTSGQSESPFSGSESEGDNNSNPSPIQSKRRKSKDSQCIRLTSKRSSSSEKEISSGITKRFKKSLNLLHSEPSWHSETPSREPAESSATKTGLIADYKCKFQRRKVFEKNHYGETSLHRAAKQSDVDLLYRLIKIGAEVNRADNAGWTALHEACVYGNYNAAKCLLEAGADVNATGFGQVAPIHDAVCQGDYEMAKLLLEHGANPHLVTEIGKSAFDYIEDVNIRNLLLLFDSKKSAPALHMDVTSRQPTIIATTPREDRGTDGNGAAVDIGESRRTTKHTQQRNATGITKLHQAATKGDVNLVGAILDGGINVNQRDHEGWTALHKASSKGFTDVIEELLEAGASINGRGLDGVRPIHNAVSGNHVEAVERLLQHGANPWLRDDNQQNALDKCCSDQMTALLIAHSSDMLPVDSTGTEFPHQKTTSDSSSTEHKYSTREKRNQSTIDTLLVIENRQENLLARSLDTSQDAGKYVEQMRFIQDILNEEVVLQRNERDMLAKKYRASVNSFRQGILREKIAALAARQKTLLTMVNRQKDVAQKITEYKQSKAPNAINGASSSLCNPITSPARNQISALCTVSKGLGANRTNGRTMATTVSACSSAPDSENIQFHHSSPSPIGYLGMNSVEDDFTNVTESEKDPENDSQCVEFKENSMEIVDDFLSLNSCCDITPPDLSDTMNNQSDCMAPGNKTPNSICTSNPINVTGTYNKDINRADLQQSLRSCHSSCASLDSHVKNTGVNIQGNSVTHYDNYQREINRSGLPDQSLSVQSTPKQIASKAEKSMRRVPIGELLKRGKIKPGQDVLEFHLQGNIYKASLLNDARIRDGSGTIYRGPVQWVKALLGNEISVTCKYVMTKVLYRGKNLSTFMTQEEDFSLKEARVTPPHEENMELSSLLVPVPKSSPKFLKIKDILLITKKDFLPIHVADERWKQFMEGDSWTA